MSLSFFWSLLLFLLVGWGAATPPKHRPFDLLSLKRPKRKAMMLMPVEMAVSMMPKMMQMKPFSIPNLIGGDMTIKLPNIKNPTVIDEFPTNTFLDANPASQNAGNGRLRRKSDRHRPFEPRHLRVEAPLSELKDSQNAT
jgi:hypothetical protein